MQKQRGGGGGRSRQPKGDKTESELVETINWPTGVDPREEVWAAFFALSNARSQAAAAGGLAQKLLLPQCHHRTYLGYDDASSEEKLAELSRWIEARFHPLLRFAPSSSDDDVNDDEEGDSETPGTEDEDEEDEEEEEEGRGKAKQATTRNRQASRSSAAHKKKQKRKAAKEDAEWDVLLKATRLVSSLAVLYGSTSPQQFVASAQLPPNAKPAAAAAHHRRARGKAASFDKPPALVDDVLQRVISTVRQHAGQKLRENPGGLSEGLEQDPKGDTQSRRWGVLRAAAMEALGVVCFVLDDASNTSDACRFLTRCYMQDVDDDDADDVDLEALWANLGDDLVRKPLAGDEEDDDDDDDDEDSQEDEDDSKSEAEDEEEDDDVRSEGKWRSKIHVAELAEALRVWAFLLSILPKAQTGLVRELLSPYARALLRLVVSADDPLHVAASSHLRVNAAILLSILAFSCGEDDVDEDEDSLLETGVLTREDKLRLLFLCRAKGRAVAGRRVRGRERREVGKRERACFRELAVQLLDGLAREERNGITSRKPKREEGRSARLPHDGRRKVETHVTASPARALFFYMGTVEDADLNQLEGWQWEHVLDFLQHYFGSFWPLFQNHPRVREAAKFMAPHGTEARQLPGQGSIFLRKVNKATVKGQKTETKRYRRMVDKNPLSNDQYRQEKQGYVQKQSLLAWRRAITDEWRHNSYWNW